MRMRREHAHASPCIENWHHCQVFKPWTLRLCTPQKGYSNGVSDIFFIIKGWPHQRRRCINYLPQWIKRDKSTTNILRGQMWSINMHVETRENQSKNGITDIQKNESVITSFPSELNDTWCIPLPCNTKNTYFTFNDIFTRRWMNAKWTAELCLKYPV